MRGCVSALALAAFALVVIGALLALNEDRTEGVVELAAIRREAARDLVFPEGTVLSSSEREREHPLLHSSAEPARIRRSYGIAATPQRVHEFYEQNLRAMGWVSDVTISYTSESESWSWCRGHAGYRVGITRPDEIARGPLAGRFATVFEAEVLSRYNGPYSTPCAATGELYISQPIVSAIVIVSFAVFMLVAQLARIRALERRGPSIERVAGIAQAAPYFFWVPYAVVWLRPGPSVVFPEPVVWSGLFLTVAGIAFACWSVFTLGRHYDLVLEVHAGHELVRSGPYTFVRHPVYAGLGLHFVGACLATGNLLFIAGTVLVTFPALYARARTEETLLRGHFGAAYEDYVREVGMLVPRLTGR